MFEQIAEAIAILRVEAAGYPTPVRAWMGVLALTFFSGLIITYWDRRALWGVAMAVVTISFLIFAKITFPEMPRSTAGAIIHLTAWPFCLIGLWRGGPGTYRIFNGWRLWVSTIAAVSLVLDLKSLL
ncbi:MAG: hypothetical protein L3J36_12955 [Rhodobacteraceae bacterium]|nr:hypothetical protein [Paracoccaceae bacterium]